MIRERGREREREREIWNKTLTAMKAIFIQKVLLKTLTFGQKYQNAKL